MERFWSKVAKSDGCWEWARCVSERGYGVFQVARKEKRRAHRVAWELTYGPIPAGIQVCHRCDNPRCVRPDHLFLGTGSDNMKDCAAKGRMAKNSRRFQGKLSEEKAAALRTFVWDGVTTRRDLAAFVDIHEAVISRVLNGKRWL